MTRNFPLEIMPKYRKRFQVKTVQTFNEAKYHEIIITLDKATGI